MSTSTGSVPSAKTAEDQDDKRRRRRRKPKKGADNEDSLTGSNVQADVSGERAESTIRADADEEDLPPSLREETADDKKEPMKTQAESSAIDDHEAIVQETQSTVPEKDGTVVLEVDANSKEVKAEDPSSEVAVTNTGDEHDTTVPEPGVNGTVVVEVDAHSKEVKAADPTSEVAVTNTSDDHDTTVTEPGVNSAETHANDPLDEVAVEQAEHSASTSAEKARTETTEVGEEPPLDAATTEKDTSKKSELDISVCLDADPQAFRENKRRIVRAILRSVVAHIALRIEGEPTPVADEVETIVEKPALPPMESMVWLELKKGVLTINPDATEVFAQCMGYVNPVMISGKLRTGKSYLMNALSDSQAFGVSSQARSFTQGVHVCDRLAPCSQFGGPEDGPQLAFLDAEGQADKGKSYDIKMATPLLLVSKVIIMNEICPTGPSKEDILRTLEIMMRAAEQVADRKKRKKLFGNLHVMMRDCSQLESECWSIVFDQEDPEISETMEQVKAIEERNIIRESIFNSFETEPRVWCLPPLKEYPAPKNYRDCCPEYVAKIDEIRVFMAKQLAHPKLLDDKPLTGSMIAALMPQLQEALKSDSPILNPPSMMQAVCDLEAERIALTVSNEADRFFRIDLARKLPLPSPYYEGEVDCVKALFAKSFKEKLDHLPKDSQEKVFQPFETRLTLMDERLAALNRERLAERATQEALNRAKELENEMAMERMRADEARAEVDKILAERDSEKERVAALLQQMEAIDEDRQAERLRIKELEDFINKEASDREAELQRQIEEEQRRVEEAEQALRDETEKQKEAEEEQARIMEEQRLQMEEMQQQIDEERKAREEAERELGLREEERALEDQAADAAEAAAEAKKEPALIYAVKAADVLAVRGLVRHHPDSLHVKDKNQRTALHFCEDEDCAQALLKAKADPNAQDMGLWSPLHNAASKGLFEIAELILDANGNVLLTTKQGNTPLDLAYEQPDMTAMLLSALPDLYNSLELEEDPGASRRRKKHPTNDEKSMAKEAPEDAVSPEMAEEGLQPDLAAPDEDNEKGSEEKGVTENENIADQKVDEPIEEGAFDPHEDQASEVVVPSTDDEA